MIKPSLHIVSQFHGSLGEITTDLIPFLKKDFVITEEFKQGPAGFDYLLCHYINPVIVQDQSFKLFNKKIVIQPIDGTVLMPEIINSLNQFDLIITPSLAGKNIMLENKVTSPIEVVPNYYKKSLTTLIKKQLPKGIPQADFIFYHESTLVNRKGMELLYEAFIKAFSDKPYTNKVLLVIKDSPLNTKTLTYKEKCKKEAIELQKKYKNPARIVKISQLLKEETLKNIWINIDAYVSFAKIEGFGIPMLRMAVLQKPIVTLENKLSGYSDFLNLSNSYMVPTTNVQAIGENSALYSKNSQWAVPNKMDDAVEQLLLCYDDTIKQKQKKVDQTQLEKYEFEKVKNIYTSLLQNL